jgi:hypothetical protein
MAKRNCARSASIRPTISARVSKHVAGARECAGDLTTLFCDLGFHRIDPVQLPDQSGYPCCFSDFPSYASPEQPVQRREL